MHGNLHRPRCFTCARPFDYPPGIPEEPEGGDRLVQPLRAWLGVEHHTGCGLLHRGGGGNNGCASVRDIQHGICGSQFTTPRFTQPLLDKGQHGRAGAGGRWTIFSWNGSGARSSTNMSTCRKSRPSRKHGRGGGSSSASTTTNVSTSRWTTGHRHKSTLEGGKTTRQEQTFLIHVSPLVSRQRQV